MFSHRNFALLKETSFIPKCEFHFFPRCRLWTVNHAAMIWHISKWKMRTKSIENFLRETPYELWQYILCSCPEQNRAVISVEETNHLQKIRVTNVLFACLWFNFQLENIPLVETSPLTVKGCILRPRGLSARRDYCRATPAVTQSLCFWNLQRRTNWRDWIVVAIFRLYWYT